jgi:hypothetical protein
METIMERRSGYVAVLRTRQAEHDALREVAPEVRPLLAPLIEVTPREASSRAELSPQRIAQWAWRFAIGSGGTGELYLDLGDLLDHPEAETICGELQYLVLSIRSEMQLVFRTRDFARRGIAAARELLQRNGAVFRITQADYLSPALNELVRFTRINRLNYSNIDLVVDCQLVADGQRLQGTVDRLERDFPWRSVTYLGGSFPPDLSDFPKNGEYEIPRIEWQAFEHEEAIHRRARYGDYTIRHPLQRDELPFPPSASIRYTGSDHWVIMRGEKPGGPERPGPEQYIGHAQLLRARPEFSGADFSAGDAYIELIASQLTGKTGNSTKWVQAGVNHHLTLAARQVARLRAA